MRKGDVVNGYKFIKKLGGGAFGQVWEVEKGGKSYAIKTMGLTDITAEMEETFAQRMRFSCPFLVKYFDSFKDPDFDDLLFVCMEICRGGDLSKLIDQLNKSESIVIAFPRLMKIFIELLLAVRELHMSKVIHRDLKPLNIFVDENFNVKVGDFGCARFISTGGKAQTRVGTLPYMCPEIFQNKPYGESSDLWAVGVIMYQLTSSELPFNTDNEYLFAQIVVNEPFKPLSKLLGYPQEFLDTIHSLLNKDPLQRPTIDALLGSSLVREYAALIEFAPGKTLRMCFPGAPFSAPSTPTPEAATTAVVSNPVTPKPTAITPSTTAVSSGASALQPAQTGGRAVSNPFAPKPTAISNPFAPKPTAISNPFAPKPTAITPSTTAASSGASALQPAQTGGRAVSNPFAPKPTAITPSTTAASSGASALQPAQTEGGAAPATAVSNSFAPKPTASFPSEEESIDEVLDSINPAFIEVFRKCGIKRKVVLADLEVVQYLSQISNEVHSGQLPDEVTKKLAGMVERLREQQDAPRQKHQGHPPPVPQRGGMHAAPPPLPPHRAGRSIPPLPPHIMNIPPLHPLGTPSLNPQPSLPSSSPSPPAAGERDSVLGGIVGLDVLHLKKMESQSTKESDEKKKVMLTTGNGDDGW